MTNLKIRGVALVQVLIMTAIMALIAIQFTKTARHQVEVAQDFNDRIKAELLLKSAKSRLIFSLFKHDSSNLSDKVVDGTKWNFRGKAFSFQSNITVSMTAATAYLSVITAPSKYIESLLLSLGLEESNSQEIIASIRDWIDNDDISLTYGAESSYYQQLSIIPRNGPMQHLSELKYIKGMTPELYESLKGLLTIYPTSSFNPALAQPSLINAIFDEDTATQINNAQLTQNFSEKTWQGIVGNRYYDYVDLHPFSTFMVAISAKYNDVIITERFDIKIQSHKAREPVVILASY